MTRLPRCICLATLLMCGVAAAAPVIKLPAEPPVIRTAVLEEIWRIGGDREEDILLGLVAADLYLV
ncbi:hypothetical protein DRQ50_10055 [bacterium]|nr:MAG: hypothetical protein DRQ50_10055 [bacterium]